MGDLTTCPSHCQPVVNPLSTRGLLYGCQVGIGFGTGAEFVTRTRPRLYTTEEQWNKQEELIKTIKSLGSNIHLLVTSRNIPKIGLLFKEDARLDIQATNVDITTFVADKLSQGDLADLINGHDSLYEAILTGVTKKANDM